MNIRTRFNRDLQSVCLLAASLFPVIAFADDTGPAYGGQCAMGMAVGTSALTDCSVSWNSDDNITYCFSSENSKSQFLENPTLNIIKADENFALSDTQKLSKRMKYYQSSDVKAFLKTYLDENTDAISGHYSLYDPLHKKNIDVQFVEIQMMRTLHGYGFFPNVVFADPTDQGKRYWVDYWLKPEGEKDLSLVEERIYKAPRKSGDDWQLVTRQPVPWWWIPASEHPGESEQKRGWEIMSAIEKFIIEKRDDNGFIQLEDDDGKPVTLEYIGLHQPVRRLSENGKYFACSDFRKAGSDNEYYDIDFWLNDQDGSIEVGEVRIHKIPEKVDGNWVQIPKYNFDNYLHEVVP